MSVADDQSTGGPEDGDLIDVRIERLAPGGEAVGPQQGGGADGRTTFVALAAPGELVTAKVRRQKRRVAWADLIAVREPSPDRVVPPCPLFGRCGGCQWQHVALAAQREAKRQIVARALGLADLRLVAPAPEGFGYRDRAHLVVGPGGEIGFHARRSHAIVDVPRCLLLAAGLDAPLRAIRASAAVFAADTEIDLQLGRDGVHVALRLPAAWRIPGGPGAPSVDDLWAAWAPHGVVGLSSSGGGLPPRSLGVPAVDIADSGEPPLRIPAGAFAQVGRAANAALAAVVLAEVGPAPGAVLELYAGSGNFTRHLVARATRVVACDGDGAAIARGRGHAPTASWRLRPPASGEVDADTVLADPPRGGLDAVNMAAAVQARRRIVYVSCDPQTLARDAGRLASSGFALCRAVALDLMPQTFHIEAVAVFERV